MKLSVKIYALFCLFISSIVLLYIFTMLPPFGGHYKAPSTSMMPTINVGDHFQVNKRPYVFNKNKVPKRGKVIVFENPITGITSVKRNIGLAGDKIEIRRGRLYLNDQVVKREQIDSYTYRVSRSRNTSVNVYKEHLSDSHDSYQIYEQSDNGFNDNRGPFIVPEGHVFVIGDNRDNSIDSRATSMGPIPIENILGEVKRILFSFESCPSNENIYCPTKRYFSKL